MSDRPWFPFHTSDWLSNAKLRRCSHVEKGVWIDLLCLMHDSPEYGVLRWSLKEISESIGCKITVLQTLIRNGVLKGADTGHRCARLEFTPASGRRKGATVTILQEQEGPIWYSSRMVVDEYKRTRRGGEIGTQQGGFSTSPKASPKGGIDDAFSAHQSRHQSHHHPRARLSESESYKTSVVRESVDNSNSVGADERFSSLSKTTPPADVGQATLIDPAFAPDEAARRLADQHDLDVDTERQRFVAYFESNEQRRANWQAAFRKWLLDSMQYRADAQARAAPGKAAPFDPLQYLTEKHQRLADEHHAQHNELDITSTAERLE